MPCHLAPAERWRWRWRCGRCGRCRLRGAPRVPGAVRSLLGTVSGGVGLDDLDVLDDVFCRGAVQLLLFDLEGIGPPTQECIHKYYQIISNLIYSNMM